jgi:hypothetical protein
MGRLIIIIRIIGALSFLACLFFFLDGSSDTAIQLGALATSCVAVVLTAELVSLYHNFFLRKRRSQ